MNKISNIELVTEIIDTVHYMDPDSPRFVDWLHLRRLKAGVDTTHSDRAGIDNSKIMAKNEFILEMLPSRSQLEEILKDNGYHDVMISEHISKDIRRRVIIADGVPVLYSSAGADSYNIVAAGIGDQLLVDLHVKPVNEHYDSIRHLEYETLTGFSDSGPVIQTTLLNESEASQMNGVDEFYPFIEGGIEKLVSDFTASTANVLLVFGPPGTGKSTLLRTINRLMGRKTNILVDDAQVIEDHRFTAFVRSIEDGSNVTIEDADALCGKRSEGNKSMSSILNQTDGILTSKTKYLISTNLTSLRNVDEALYRKGRTFKVIEFIGLTPTEANNARTALGLDPVEFSSASVTLSNALNHEVDNNGHIPKVGF